jgi:hypothetical protein
MLESAWKPLAVGFVGALLIGCTAEVSEPGESEPSASNEEEWWDEGPPPGDDAEWQPSDEEPLGTTDSALSTSVFQLPFPCGQVWVGQTRTTHSPVNAVDFNRADDFGDKVVAAARGTVRRVENEGNTSYGRWIEIGHGDGYRTRYAHLSTQVVSVGQKVARGQKIGNVGNSGGSFGAHLHYELRRWGTPIKPMFNGKQALFFGTRNYTSHNCK